MLCIVAWPVSRVCFSATVWPVPVSAQEKHHQ